MNNETCKRTPTERPKWYTYEERYTGPEDEDGRRSGIGKNHWRGSYSLECYKGNFIRNAMNGHGDYRWRYLGLESEAITYEGKFYANHLHGYGTMSFPCGVTFTGLYNLDMCWGPGVMSHVNLKQDIGFWRGNHLVRLAWRPPGTSITLDLLVAENGSSFVEPYRKLLATGVKKIGKTNKAIELLEECGADPVWASKNWTKLYSKYSTDIKSPACQVDVFDNDYYNGPIQYLEEIDRVPEENAASNEDINNVETYNAWNNSEMMVDMMKHCYKHDDQRVERKVSLAKILNGSRRYFKPPDRRERDSRTLLLASYLGHIIHVAQIINECDVCPDVTDMQGNTAIMYAACGDYPSVIHFLVEAGADINLSNDSCCTALGLALMRYVCVYADVPKSKMVQALLPPTNENTQPTISSTESKTLEWLINRRLPIQDFKNKSIKYKGRSTSNTKKVKSTSIIEIRKKNSKLFQTEIMPEYDSDNSSSEDKKLYTTLSDEYAAKEFVSTSVTANDIVNIPYIFAVKNVIDDIIREVSAARHSIGGEKMNRKISSSARPLSKQTSSARAVKVVEVINIEDDPAQESARQLKEEMLSRIMLTISQLLIDGADPKLVRCPQPALFMAVAAESAELVRYLNSFDVNIHERNGAMLNYTALEYAISRPFTSSNVEVISALLENGANAKDRMLSTYDEYGPTLMHAVLARPCATKDEEQLVVNIVNMLLEHHCDPTAQYNGRSAIDIAMMKTPDLLNTFIKNMEIDLNKAINQENQTILVKIFSLPYFKSTTVENRFTILTDLLLNGADPLIQCQNEDEKFDNVFIFAKQNLAFLEDSASKVELKSITSGKRKLKSDTKIDRKSTELKRVKFSLADINDYKVALDLVTECARLLLVRWLQAKLLKSLFAIIYKFKHRQWNMILKELPDEKAKSTGLWLTPQRCLEIWDILKSTHKPIYKDNKILKHLLCLVQYLNKRSKKELPKLNGAEKTMIEFDVGHLLKEHYIVSRLADEAEAWKGIYVKPELFHGNEEKFNICFECALPLKDFTIVEKIICPLCKLVSFCSYICLRKNVLKIFCHPCNEYLKQKYLANSFILEI